MNETKLCTKVFFNTVFFTIVIIFTINSVYSAPYYRVDLTAGTWNISAVDKSGLTWEGSTLIFESQTAEEEEEEEDDDDDDNIYLLKGHFNWIGSNGSFGRENFTGTLFSDNTLKLSGFELAGPRSGIVICNYFAILADNGTEIINGSWDGSGIPSDDWSATLQPAKYNRSSELK